MPAVTVPIDAIALGPGYLYWAVLGTTGPANTVAGGKFTDPWPVEFLLLGATDEGSEFSYGLETDPVEVAEYLDPLAVVSTGRTITKSFDLVQISATNLKRALNGGTITTTGTAGTELNEYEPPDVGNEVRAMIGWESNDATERLVGYQVFQTGEITIGRKKGADKATLPTEWTFEKPPTGPPFRYWTAGTKRA